MDERAPENTSFRVHASFNPSAAEEPVASVPHDHGIPPKDIEWLAHACGVISSISNGRGEWDIEQRDGDTYFTYAQKAGFADISAKIARDGERFEKAGLINSDQLMAEQKALPANITQLSYRIALSAILEHQAALKASAPEQEQKAQEWQMMASELHQMADKSGLRENHQQWRNRANDAEVLSESFKQEAALLAHASDPLVVAKYRMNNMYNELNHHSERWADRNTRAQEVMGWADKDGAKDNFLAR